MPEEKKPLGGFGRPQHPVNAPGFVVAPPTPTAPAPEAPKAPEAAAEEKK